MAPFFPGHTAHTHVHRRLRRIDFGRPESNAYHIAFQIHDRRSPPETPPPGRHTDPCRRRKLFRIHASRGFLFLLHLYNVHFLWTALIAASGADIPSALGLSIATMSNSGPALGQFGATCNWSAMPAMTKWSPPCPCLWAGLNLLRFSSFSSPLSGEKRMVKQNGYFSRPKSVRKYPFSHARKTSRGLWGSGTTSLYIFANVGEHLLKRGAEAT